jgi:adenylylsulfate kinase-like enzyme
VVFLTGLPAAGKSAIAYALERRLFDLGKLAVVVDPDDGLTRDLRADGGSPSHAPELARRFSDAGLITVFAFAAPLRADREAVRAAVGSERFVEIHVATSAAVARERDTRGIWDWAHEPPSFEAPEQPDAVVALDDSEPEEIARKLAEMLAARSVD